MHWYICGKIVKAYCQSKTFISILTIKTFLLTNFIIFHTPEVGWDQYGRPEEKTAQTFLKLKILSAKVKQGKDCSSFL